MAILARTKIHRWPIVVELVAILLLGCPQAATSAEIIETSADTLSASPFGRPTSPGLSAYPTWRVGGYIGALDHHGFLNINFHPWEVELEPDYLADVHAVYMAHRFESLPLDLELEGDFAKRFGQNHQAEFDLIPTVRWEWFPWNDWLYTNFRLGLIGLSYVTGISQWEIENSGVNRGSRLLNMCLSELTLSSGPAAKWEFMLGVHHRSGIYGLIDHGINGASNYPFVGLRFVLH